MKAVIEIIAVVLLCSLFFILGKNSTLFEVKRAEVTAYQQGYKDALYKRPASDDLEAVCAGLWLSQLKPNEK